MNWFVPVERDGRLLRPLRLLLLMMVVVVMVVFVEAVGEAEASGCGSVEKEVGTVW